MKLIKCLVLLILVPCVAFSESQPEDVINQLLKGLKETGSAAYITEFVHWPSAFKNLPDEQKEQLSLKNSEELKLYMKEVLTDPGKFIKEKMDKQIGTLPVDQQEMMKKSLAQSMQKMDTMKQQIKEKMQKTNYSILSTKKADDTASIEVQSELDGDKKTSTIQLKLIDGRWYLPSASFANFNRDISMK